MNEFGFGDLLKSAVLSRKSFFELKDTNCFRLFNASGDGLDGITVDYYDGHILVQYFTREVENSIFDYLAIIGGLSSHVDAPIKSILLKNRKTVRGNQDFDELRDSRIVEGDYPEGGIAVLHNGIKANVDLIHGQSTGIFMDMYQVRADLAPYYKSGDIKSVLNLFSYTALFSVHALLNGAENAINVDLSKAVLKRARENYVLNSLKVDERDFVYGDSLEWVKIFGKKRRKFDLVIFDPPTFARNRKKKFSVRRDFPAMLNEIGKIVSENGFVLTSINSYSVPSEEYMKSHPAGWENIRFWTESADFKYSDNHYLKAGLWKPAPAV